MSKKATYSDGDIEIELRKFFENTPPEQRQESIGALLSDNPSWPLLYHTSPKRENLLNWIPLKETDLVLEVGAGCGALTAVLAKKTKRVTALELTQQRSDVNEARNGHFKNIDFVVKNLEDYKPKTKFDVITCVGVLEYAGMFIDSPTPYKTFLDKLHSLLKPGGKLILAIENRLGIKYLSGAREDHTGRFYDGIEDYPLGTKIKTFGRTELKKLLGSSNFNKTDFYFPYPDYKMPLFVTSEAFARGKFYFPYSAFPSPSLDQGRLHVFSEQLAIKSFMDNDLYPDVANSFLVIAEAQKR